MTQKAKFILAGLLLGGLVAAMSINVAYADNSTDAEVTPVAVEEPAEIQAKDMPNDETSSALEEFVEWVKKKAASAQEKAGAIMKEYEQYMSEKKDASTSTTEESSSSTPPTAETGS